MTGWLLGGLGAAFVFVAAMVGLFSMPWAPIWFGKLGATAVVTSGGPAEAGGLPIFTGAAIYWGANVAGVPFNPAAIDRFEQLAGKRASIIHWGQPWFEGGQPQPFDAGLMERVRQRGSIPMLDWGSWDNARHNDPNQPDFRLSEIASGRYDAYVRAWAQAAAAWGHPFFLRFDHEMNGDWQFPWSAQLNGNTPADYVAAWRHVHDIFSQAGAGSVTWVWCPNIAGPRTVPYAEVWPGAAYVDWTCLDGYNHGGAGWQSFAGVFGSSYDQITGLSGKPLMIGETGSAEQGGSKADWIGQMLADDLPRRFPKVQALVWFDLDQWDIASSAGSAAAFRQGIASPYYASAVFAGLPAGPVGIIPIVIVPPRGQGVSDVFRFELARSVGWSTTDAITATAISIAEDGSGDPAALSPRNANGTFDLGLWQINSAHWPAFGGQAALTDPTNNARAAFVIWQRGGWNQWCTFPGGCGGGPGSPAWPQALKRAQAAAQQSVPPGQE